MFHNQGRIIPHSKMPSSWSSSKYSVPQSVWDTAAEEGWSWERSPNKGHFLWRNKQNRDMIVQFWTTTRTCTTTLRHPRKRANTYNNDLQRFNIDDEELKELFRNPRLHTGKGYAYKAHKEEQIKKYNEMARRRRDGKVRK